MTSSAVILLKMKNNLETSRVTDKQELRDTSLRLKEENELE